VGINSLSPAISSVSIKGDDFNRAFYLLMKTHYYCTNCNIYFYEEKLPNINRVHYECGSSASIIKHFSDVESQEEEE